MLKDFEINASFVGDINKNHLSKLLLHTSFIVKGGNASEIEEFKNKFQEISKNASCVCDTKYDIWLNLECKEWIKQCLYILTSYSKEDDKMKKALEKEDPQAIKDEKEAVQKVVYEITTKMYQENPEAAQQAAQEAAGEQAGSTEEAASSDQSSDENVVDAEFTEVNDKK